MILIYETLQPSGFPGQKSDYWLSLTCTKNPDSKQQLQHPKIAIFLFFGIMLKIFTKEAEKVNLNPLLQITVTTELHPG